MRRKRSISLILAVVLAHKFAFLRAFFLIMLASYGFLYLIDFIPEPIKEEPAPEPVSADMAADEPVLTAPQLDAYEDVEPRSDVAQFPLSISIDALGRTVSVLNPTSRTVADLDAALLKGAVRHPDSADFHENGNILILGHSSYLPTVFNKNFQAFNGLQDLSWGDIIRLRSADTEYIYRVERVYEAKASEVTVPNSRGAAKLTLATCNTFGAKEDRFIVEAGLVSSRPL